MKKIMLSVLSSMLMLFSFCQTNDKMLKHSGEMLELKYYGLKTHRLNRGLKVHLVASPFFNFVYYASFKKVCRS
jgi:hypothetical protein